MYKRTSQIISVVKHQAKTAGRPMTSESKHQGFFVRMVDSVWRETDSLIRRFKWTPNFLLHFQWCSLSPVYSISMEAVVDTISLWALIFGNKVKSLSRLYLIVMTGCGISGIFIRLSATCFKRSHILIMSSNDSKAMSKVVLDLDHHLILMFLHYYIRLGLGEHSLQILQFKTFHRFSFYTYLFLI